MLSLLFRFALRYLYASSAWYAGSSNHPGTATFELRHAHGLVHNTSRVVFHDVSHDAFGVETYEVATQLQIVSKSRCQSKVFHADPQSDDPLWDTLEVKSPNVHDRRTLQMLAKMASNSYYENHGANGWYDLGPEWNTVGIFLYTPSPADVEARRAIRLAGNPTLTDLEAISSLMKTTPPSLSPSRGLLPDGL
jgi:hypothetical protein